MRPRRYGSIWEAIIMNWFLCAMLAYAIGDLLAPTQMRVIF